MVSHADCPTEEATKRDITHSASKYMAFFTFEHIILTVRLISDIYINIICNVMTYFIIKDTLIMTYLFYYLQKK
jgi:hypothetical protein